MVYIENIKTALLFFPLIAFLFTIPFMLIQYHKYGAINKFRTLIVFSNIAVTNKRTIIKYARNKTEFNAI